MGNRAIIKGEGKTIGSYLHWNGGRDSVEPFLEYCRLKEYGDFEDSYGLARFSQVVGNFFGGSTSLGIENNINQDYSGLDNGIYVVKGWEITKRIPSNIYEQRVYDFLEMLILIDSAQPKEEQLGNYIGAIEIKTSELKIGDQVYYFDSIKGKVESYPIVGFGEDIVVNGTKVKGIPYMKMYGKNDEDYANNINNYITTKTIKIVKLTEEYKKIKCEKVREMFEDDKEKQGILIYIPEVKQYLSISFGDGTNGNNLCEGCNDYIYISQFEFDNGSFEEVDGGQLDFNTEVAGYNNNICNTIYDVLDFIYGNECIEFEVMQ